MYIYTSITTVDQGRVCLQYTNMIKYEYNLLGIVISSPTVSFQTHVIFPKKKRGAHVRNFPEFQPQNLALRRVTIPWGRWLFFESQSFLWPRHCQCPSWSFGQAVKGDAFVCCTEGLLWNLGWWCCGLQQVVQRKKGILVTMCGFDGRMMSFLVTICVLPSRIVINWNLHQGL